MPSINKIRYEGTDYDILGDELNDLKDDFDQLSADMETKANIDGYYENMTVGDAEQLVSTVTNADDTPYNFRTTAGSADVGDRAYVDAIVGGTLSVNQLVQNKPTASQNGVTFTNNGNGTYTVNGTASSDAYFVLTDNLVKQHTYLISVNGAVNTGIIHIGYENTFTRSAKIITANGTNAIGFRVNTGDTADSEVVTPQVFDLTQMFGSTIADYIYSLEQATAGAGVAWFKKLFPNMDAEYSYHEDSFDEESPLITKKLRDYQPGILLSIEGLASHNTVGFNQWDEESEPGYWDVADGTGKASTVWYRSKNPISCIPNTQYCISQSETAGGLGYILFYDADGNYLNAYQQISGSVYGGTGQVFITPANCYQMKFYANVTNFSKNICINLSWSGWRNGEYEAYQKHSYPLDDSLTLRGIPKLDAQNNLYYDGDEYLSDGTVTRKYGVVDLGTLEYTRTNSGLFRSSDVFNCKKGGLSSVLGNIIAQGYVTMSSRPITGPNGTEPSPNMVCALASGTSNIYLNNTSYTDAASFKAAMSGIMLVYELAEPTTETAEPYQHVQICDDFGTEEYVSTSIVPVGHNTRYPANLRDKLQHLPDLADSDGYYMIGQANKQMYLELFRIPKAPTTDGTYTLKATVSGGTPTYTWEAQT